MTNPIRSIYWHVLGTAAAYPEDENNDEAMHVIEAEGVKNVMAVNMCTTVSRLMKRIGKSLLHIGTVHIDHWEHNDQGYIHPLLHKSFFNPAYRGDGSISPNPHCKNQGRPIVVVAGRDTEDLHHKELSGLQRVNGKHLDLRDYAKVKQVADGESFEWQDMIGFKTVRLTHADADHEKGTLPIYSRGLRFNIGGVEYYFTGDYNMTDLPVFEKNMKEADVILSDGETTAFSSGVHPNLKDLAKHLDPEIKKKILFYSMNHGVGETELNGSPVPDAKKLGFAGILHPGARLTLGHADQNFSLGHSH